MTRPYTEDPSLESHISTSEHKLARVLLHRRVRRMAHALHTARTTQHATCNMHATSNSQHACNKYNMQHARRIQHACNETARHTHARYGFCPIRPYRSEPPHRPPCRIARRAPSARRRRSRSARCCRRKRTATAWAIVCALFVSTLLSDCVFTQVTQTLPESPLGLSV